MVTIIERLRAEAAVKRTEADRDRLTDDDRTEAALREEIARHEATAREKDREAMALGLARHEDAAREALGPKAAISGLMPDDAPTHAFVIRYSGSRPFTAWENGIGLSHMGSKDPKTHKAVDRAEVNKTYALTLVHEWGQWVSGEIVWVTIEPSTDAYARLSALLDGYSGIASTICIEGRALSGAAMEARKR